MKILTSEGVSTASHGLSELSTGCRQSDVEQFQTIMQSPQKDLLKWKGYSVRATHGSKTKTQMPKQFFGKNDKGRSAKKPNDQKELHDEGLEEEGMSLIVSPIDMIESDKHINKVIDFSNNYEAKAFKPDYEMFINEYLGQLVEEVITTASTMKGEQRISMVIKEDVVPDLSVFIKHTENEGFHIVMFSDNPKTLAWLKSILAKLKKRFCERLKKNCLLDIASRVEFVAWT